jgi:hypothetical protein
MQRGRRDSEKLEARERESEVARGMEGEMKAERELEVARRGRWKQTTTA